MIAYRDRCCHHMLCCIVVVVCFTGRGYGKRTSQKRGSNVSQTPAEPGHKLIEEILETERGFNEKLRLFSGVVNVMFALTGGQRVSTALTGMNCRKEGISSGAAMKKAEMNFINHARSPMSKKSLAILLGDMLEMSDKFLEAVTQLMAMSRPKTQAGQTERQLGEIDLPVNEYLSVLKRMKQLFSKTMARAYADYGQMFDRDAFQDAYIALGTPDFNKILQKISTCMQIPVSLTTTLQVLLIEPVQRGPRYVMFFKELVKTHPLVAPLTTRAHEFTNEMNFGIKAMAEADKMKEKVLAIELSRGDFAPDSAVIFTEKVLKSALVGKAGTVLSFNEAASSFAVKVTDMKLNPKGEMLPENVLAKMLRTK